MSDAGSMVAKEYYVVAITWGATSGGSAARPSNTVSFSTFTMPGLPPFTFWRCLGLVYETGTLPLPRACQKPNKGHCLYVVRALQLRLNLAHETQQL